MKPILVELLKLAALCAAILAISCCLILCDAEGAEREAVVDAIVTEAMAQDFDPTTALAIALVESDLNVNAVGAIGEVGIFQLRPEFHDVRPGDYRHNARVAIKYLKRVQALCSADYGDAWYLCYQHGPNKRLTAPLEAPYYNKVQRMKRELAPHAND